MASLCLKFFCNSCRSAYLGFSGRGQVPCTWWCFRKNFWKETPFPFLLWKMWFSLHSSWGCILLSQISKTTLNYSHFCQRAGAVPVLLSHVLVFCKIWHTLRWEFGNHFAIRGSHLGGEMEEVWPKWNILLYMSVELYNLKRNHDA